MKVELTDEEIKDVGAYRLPVSARSKISVVLTGILMLISLVLVMLDLKEFAYGAAALTSVIFISSMYLQTRERQKAGKKFLEEQKDLNKLLTITPEQLPWDVKEAKKE